MRYTAGAGIGANRSSYRGPDLTNSIRAGRSDILAAVVKVPVDWVVAVGRLAHRMPIGPATCT